VDNLECVEKIVVYSRGKTELTGPRKSTSTGSAQVSSGLPAEEMDAEDPLFLLFLHLGFHRQAERE